MSIYIPGLVSVIMPTYKRSEKLDRAIQSILGQTYKHIEVLLVDDNIPGDDFSKSLKEKVKKYEADSRFHLILQKKHTNGAVARNVGIKVAKGEYIAFLDDDDWWHKDKIEKQVNKLKQLGNEWGVVSCRIEQYENNTLIARLPKYRDGYIYKDILFLQCDFATGTLVFRHDALDKCRYFDEKLLRHQDLQLLVDFTSRYKLYQLNDFLHCCDVSDAANRPSGEKLLKYKKEFFISISAIMNQLSMSDRKCIFCVHNFEVGYVFFKERQYFKGIKYCSSIFTSLKAFKLITKKILNKFFL